MIDKTLFNFEINALRCLLNKYPNLIEEIEKNIINLSVSSRSYTDAGSYTDVIIQSPFLLEIFSDLSEFPIGCSFSHPKINNGGGALLWFNKENSKMTLEIYVYIIQNWMREAEQQPLSFKWELD